MVELKDCANLELKYSDEGHGSFEGYASTFGNVDMVGDTIAPGAFAETIPAFVKTGSIYINHGWKSGASAVGFIESAFEDSAGLCIKAGFHSTASGQEARKMSAERIAKGKTVGLSIGYAVPKGGAARDTKSGIRTITKANLFEVSIVGIPADAHAGMTSAKDIFGGEPHAGLSMDAHSSAVLDAVEEFVARVKDLRDLRAKEGRPLSEKHRERLTGLHTGLVELLKATEPKADMGDTLAAYGEAQRILAHLNGMPRR